MNHEVWGLCSRPDHGVGKGRRQEQTWVCRDCEELGSWMRGGQRGQCQERAEARGPPMIPRQLLGPAPLPSALCPHEAPGLVPYPTSPSPSPSHLGKPAWLLARPLYLAPWQFPGCGRGRIRANPEIVPGPSPGPLGVGDSQSPVIMRLSSCLADPGTQGWETVDGNRTGTDGL